MGIFNREPKPCSTCSKKVKTTECIRCDRRFCDSCKEKYGTGFGYCTFCQKEMTQEEREEYGDEKMSKDAEEIIEGLNEKQLLRLLILMKIRDEWESDIDDFDLEEIADIARKES